MSADPRWIRGIARRHRYVGVGRAGSLYRWLDDLPGGRGFLERFALAPSGWIGRGKAVDDPTIQDAWQRLSKTIPGIRSALMVYTGFYKDTILSGVVDAGHRRFVKVFAETFGGEAESGRLADLSYVVPTSVILADVELNGNGVIAYELLEHRRRRASHHVLEDAAIAIGTNALANSGQFEERDDANWASTVSGTFALLTEFGARMSDHSRATLLALTPPWAIAHGDFTPWNVFASRDDRLAVVDYERVGRRSPFTDLWHLMTQPSALSGNVEIPSESMARVRNAAKCDDVTVLGWYCGYLLEELSQDATDWVVHGRHHPQLRRLIVSKIHLLEAASRDERTR